MMTVTNPHRGFSLEEEQGILVVTLYWESIIHERSLAELRDQVVEALPQATTAVLFDCRKLTGPATSQFLATLVAIRKAALCEGLFVCVAHLGGPAREAYRVTRLDRIIPAYDDRHVALRAVGDYGLGRISVGKPEPARLAASARNTDAAPSNPLASGAALTGQVSSALVLAAGSWSSLRENFRDATQSLSRRQLAQLAAVAAAVVAVIGLAWFLLSPASPSWAGSIVDDRPLVFGGQARSTLVGKVNVQRGELVNGDAGALVFAWRVGESPQQKVLTKTVDRYLNEALAHEKFPQPWLHVARTSETGDFRLGIDTPGEFDLLVISGSTTRGPTLTSADETTLAQWFESPGELIGRHPYRLLRQRIDQREVSLIETFER